MLTIGAVTGYIGYNQIRNNDLIGVGIRASSSDYAVGQNYFYNNARRYRSYDMPKLSPAVARTGNVLPRHTELANSTNIRINTNYYYDK